MFDNEGLIHRHRLSSVNRVAVEVSRVTLEVASVRLVTDEQGFELNSRDMPVHPEFCSTFA
jgi:hypothetical protein